MWRYRNFVGVKFQPSLGTGMATADRKYKSIIRAIMTSATFIHNKISGKTQIVVETWW